METGMAQGGHLPARGAQGWRPGPAWGIPAAPAPWVLSTAPNPALFPVVLCATPSVGQSSPWGPMPPRAAAPLGPGGRLRGAQHRAYGADRGAQQRFGGAKPKAQQCNNRAEPKLRSSSGRVCPLAPAAALRSAAPAPPGGGTHWGALQPPQGSPRL